MNYRYTNSSAFVTRLGRTSLFLLLGALGASTSLAGCEVDGDSNASEDGERAGALDLNLHVAPGVTINSVTYTITRDGFSKTGSINLSGAQTISAKIGGLPANTGYTITLNAISVEGDTTFTGSAIFDVKAGVTSSVTVKLKGTQTSGNGSVKVDGTINVSPVIDELSVSPLAVNIGGSVALSSVSHDPDEWPSALSYYWSTTGGVIDNPIAANATLTSTTPGTFTVTLTVSDGDATTTTTQAVTFVNPDPDGGGDPGPAKPNVLLIIADDLGAASTSLYPDLNGDSGAVPIPNIETLAENGLVFDNAWASPVCSPTRGTIVSGQYGYRTGVTNVGDVLPIATVSLFDRLNAESPDYTHAFFGKYHVGGGSIDPRSGVPFPGAAAIVQHARDIGVKTFNGILGGGVVDYFDWVTYDTNGPARTTKTYATTALTDYAIDFIRLQETTNPGKPWFIYQAYNAPHAANGGNNPYQVPPANLHNVDLSPVGSPAPGAYATNIPLYKANIQALDTEIGRLLSKVDLTKTTVIFIGDNGVPPPVTDVGQGIRGSKGSVYEGGVRIPLVVAGAGVTRRGREENLFVTPDLYATILNLTGLSVSQVNDSFSLKPVLSDETASSGRKYSYSESGKGAQHRYAIKDNRYKIAKAGAARELFDLVADPLETTNLYSSAAHAAVRATLEGELATLKASASATYFP